MQRAPATRIAPWLAGLALIGLFGFRFSSVLANADSHFVDFDALHGGRLVFELPDTRLNSWILGWVDHTALRAPGDLYHANIHYPERNVLTGSEHLFGVALQMLPFEPFVDGAIARHQLALALSSVLLAATSFAAVHWATHSLWASALAAAFSLLMPWRVTELAHLQLSSVGLVPLVWLGLTRGLLGDTRTRGLTVLGVAVTLQLLSSFYIAYYLTLSCGVLVAVVAWLHPPRTRDLLRLALATAPGFLLFAASALPYLARRAEAQLSSQYDVSLAIPLAQVLGHLAPRWPYGWETLNEPANYWTPWAVAVLAFIAASRVVPAVRRVRGGPESTERERAFATGLVAVAILSLVMMFGGSIEIAGTRWPTLSRLFAETLPGFSLLRGPTRWGILAATALPLLAALGAHTVDTWANRRGSARALVALASAASFAWFAIPTTPAWQNPRIIEKRYEAVRNLPPGALLELPWSLGSDDIGLGSRSVLASTLHWRPIVNGYTGHRPRSFRFLQRIAGRLPDNRSLDQLRRLVGLRFVLLDLQRVQAPLRGRWAAAESSGRVRSVHTSLYTRIYELLGTKSSDLIAPLIDPTPRLRTFNGLGRARLELTARAGKLEVQAPKTHMRDRPNKLRVHLHNTSDAIWPGFDIDDEGLVQLRYSYFPLETEREGDDTPAPWTAIGPLDVDIAAHSTSQVVMLLYAPPRGGSYELCTDLIQRVEGQIHPLPLTAVRNRVFVQGTDNGGELTRLIRRFLLRPELPPCGSHN